MIYDITPVPKPRQTKSDKYKKRPPVLRYRAFADECKLKSVKVYERTEVDFYMPMPKSWSKKKRAAMDGQPHQSKPDIDNLVKALFDAVCKDDSHIYEVHARKFWGEKGMFIVCEIVT